MPDVKEAYQLYRDTVYGFIYRMSRNHDLAEELTQETFYQAVKQWHKYRGESSVSTWLCAIAKRLYFSELRKRKDIPPSLLTEDGQASMDEAFVDKDLAMSAQIKLHAMPEPYREVFMLKTFCNMSHEQIGMLFEKSASWARVTYHRARMMLIEAMKGEMKDE